MSYSNTQETTSLKTKVFESSHEWDIENFKEYSKCNIGSITSRRIPIEGTQAYWTLSIHPNGYHHTHHEDENYFSVSIAIKDKNPSRNHCFRIEVMTNVMDHMNMSSRNLEESTDSSLSHVDPVRWTAEYENIGEEKHMEFYEEDFFKGKEMPTFLLNGTLRLLASVSMKSLEICDRVKGDEGNHQFYKTIF